MSAGAIQTSTSPTCRVNLARKIIDMHVYCEPKAIADSLQIPEEIVLGIIDGTLDSSSLDDFDPSRPYEIKVVREDGLKVIEQKLEKIESARSKSRALQMFSRVWGLLLDAIWVIGLLICVGCTIYGLYFVGQANGFENEILTKAANYIEDVFIKLQTLF